MERPSPLISVIMPVYNGENYLHVSLGSAVEQLKEGADAEIVVINGSSTDRTAEIIASFAEATRLEVLAAPRETNWVQKTNIGIRHARGRYITFLHHDDRMLPGRLKFLADATERFPDSSLFFHPVHFISGSGKRVGKWRPPFTGDARRIPSRTFIERLLIQNFISTAGALFDREQALTVGLMDERLWFTADWKLWLGLAQGKPTGPEEHRNGINPRGSIVYLPEPLSEYRIHGSALTLNGARDRASFEDQLTSVAREFGGALFQELSGVKQASNLSIRTNVALARLSYRDFAMLKLAMGAFLTSSPLVWKRYIRDSRIMERELSRVRAGLSGQ